MKTIHLVTEDDTSRAVFTGTVLSAWTIVGQALLEVDLL